MTKRYVYTLNRIQVAAYDPDTGVYSSPLSLEADHQFMVEPETDTDKMRDSGQITRGLSVYVGAKVTIGYGGLDFDELAVLEGGTKTAYVDAAAKSIPVLKTAPGGSGLPYFGAIGEAASDGGEVIVVGLAAVKLDTPLKKEFNGTENKFMVQEAAGYAFAVNGIVDLIKEFEDDAHWATHLPTDGTEFGEFFTELGS